MGWDGIDEWKALSLGWKVRSFREYPMWHYRFTGAATGFLKSCIEQGDGAYRMGYHPLFMVARGVRRMTDRPYVIGGIAMVAAYFRAWLRREEMLADASVVHFVRQDADAATGRSVSWETGSQMNSFQDLAMYNRVGNILAGYPCQILNLESI